MPSGGARTRSGPPPNPDALRRDRPSDAAQWLTLTPRTEPAPEWPLTDLTDREAAIWAREWALPQANEWARLSLELEVALYVRTFVAAESHDASGKTRDLVRMYRDNLGLSVPALDRLKWKIAGSAPTPTTATKSAGTKAKPARASSRDRLSVVPAVEDDDSPPF